MINPSAGDIFGFAAILVSVDVMRVHHIEVYQTDPWDMAIIWPEGLAGLLYPATDTPAGS